MKTKKAIDYKTLDTWEAVCKAKGTDPVKSLPFPKPKDAEDEAQNAFFQISTIREYFNGGKPTDKDGWAHFPRFIKVKDSKAPSGFRLSYRGCRSDTRSHSGVGSRHEFNSPEKAIFAGENFTKIYEKLYLIPKKK